MVEISKLHDVAEFAATIADRCWHAWWTDTEVTLAEYQSGIEEMRQLNRIPIAFVAHHDETYIGSVLLIENDLRARPNYTPWIAALWVEPINRRNGIAFTLIEAARLQAKALGYSNCYLCANEKNSSYYSARGFRLIEADVEGLNVLSISSHE